jgi:hypothetical protein
MTTVKGILEAASLMFVIVTTGAEARPSTTAKVIWVGGTTRPSNMASGDIWMKEATTGATAPSIVTTTLNTITQSVAFSQTLAVNGTTPILFSVASGTLPAGLTLNTNTGNISGTPSAAGTYAFSVTAQNAQGSSTQSYSGNVTAAALAPTITSTAMNTITQGTAFSQTLNATGTQPISWTVSGGLLPAGLTLGSSNGTISGTATGTGAYSFTITATNTAGSNSKGFTGTIGSTGTAPNIVTTTLGAMQAGVSYTQAITATGSTPMTWGISTGTIPAGLSINSSTGTVSGTPSAAGAYSFTVQSTNAFGSDTQAYTGTVAAATSSNIYSIFGSTTWPLTSYTDGVVGGWQVHQYYQFTGNTALPVGSKIVGARLYVPPGSAHIGQTWKASLYLNNTGNYISSANTVDSTAKMNESGVITNGSVLVEGWNEVLFRNQSTSAIAEFEVPSGAGNSWLIGTMINNGDRYLYDSTYTGAAVQNPSGKNFYLSEVGTTPAARSLYLSGASTARWYGIDVLVKILS